MKILSQANIKDYYDYVAHQFGGGDPKIPYVRKRLVQPILAGGTLVEGYAPIDGRVFTIYTTQYLYSNKTVPAEIANLFVCGKCFYLQRFGDKWSFIEPGKYDRWRQGGDACAALVATSKKYKAPIFRFGRSIGYNVEVVFGDYFKLAGTPIASQYSPEQMYQMIEAYIVNVLNDNPDKATPVFIEDKYRIVQHGFDLKKSFRHRV